MGTGGFYAIRTISTTRNRQIKYCHNLLDRRFFYGNNRVSNIFNMNDYTVKVACTTYYSASFEAETFDEAKKLVSKNDELKDSWTKVQCAELKPDGYIFNVIHSALYFIQENKSLKDAIKFSGSANYCSVLVGAIKACLSK